MILFRNQGDGKNIAFFENVDWLFKTESNCLHMNENMRELFKGFPWGADFGWLVGWLRT